MRLSGSAQQESLHRSRLRHALAVVLAMLAPASFATQAAELGAADEYVVLQVGTSRFPEVAAPWKVIRVDVAGEIHTQAIAIKKFTSFGVSSDGALLTFDSRANPPTAGHFRLVASSALPTGQSLEAVVNLLDSRAVHPSGPLAISPRPTVSFAGWLSARARQESGLPGSGQLVIATPAGVQFANLGGAMQCPRAPSLSPRDEQVAFYFAPSVEDSEGAHPRFGVAVAGVDGPARALVAPSAIPVASWALDWPPMWSPDGIFLYFSTGPTPDEGLRPEAWANPAVCRRVDVRTGEITTVAKGTACSISPDGTYLLLSRCPGREIEKVADDGTPIPKNNLTCKVDTRTLEVSPLWTDAEWPRLSRSGKYAAVIWWKDPQEKFLRFYGTDDWSLLKAVRLLDPPDSTATPICWVVKKK